jgi:hypothetical protein
MHEQVKCFVVWLLFDSNLRHAEEDETAMEDVSYFLDVASRLPHLTHLDRWPADSSQPPSRSSPPASPPSNQ